MHVVWEYLLVIGLHVYITRCQNLTLNMYFHKCIGGMCNSCLFTLRPTTSKYTKMLLQRRN